MKKNKESEITLSETKATSTQTPIEIALKIDENGMTTASQLYYLRIKIIKLCKMVYSQHQK